MFRSVLFQTCVKLYTKEAVLWVWLIMAAILCLFFSFQSCMYVCMCMYLWVYVCICVYVYIHHVIWFFFLVLRDNQRFFSFWTLSLLTFPLNSSISDPKHLRIFLMYFFLLSFLRPWCWTLLACCFVFDTDVWKMNLIPGLKPGTLLTRPEVAQIQALPWRWLKSCEPRSSHRERQCSSFL